VCFSAHDLCSRVVDGGAESEVTVDEDVDGSRLSARRASTFSTVRSRRRKFSSGVELVRSIPARDLVGAGEIAGEGVDDDGGDALAFERCEERVRVAPR